MKRLFKLSAATMLVAAMAACSNDEPQVSTGTDVDTPDTDVAYVSINIKDVNSSRATAGSFEYGTTDENKIENAKFLFFDSDGKFLLEANVWNGGNPGTQPNVEYIGNNVLVLEGLLSTGYPKSLVTVLNAPDNLVPEVGVTTIEDVHRLATDIRNADGTFVMSTTSYLIVGADSTRPIYYATPLSRSNFNKEPNPTPVDATVTVYVERLASKIRLNVSNSIKHITFPKLNLVGYSVPTSISGNVNDEGVVDEGVTDVYVTFEGWGLSNYEPQSYLLKNLDKYFNTNVSPYLGKFYFNDPANFRTYWAQSMQYGVAEPDLVRNTYDNLSYKINEDCAYIPETTNSLSNIRNVVTVGTNTTKFINAKNVASVLVKSVVRDNIGNPLDVIQFQGINYLKSSYIAYAMQILKPRLNFWTKTVTEVEGSTPDSHYEQITLEQVKLSNVVGGKTGEVVLVANLDDDAELWGKNAEGKWEAKTVAELNAVLASFNATSRAIAYTDGAQYYNIPIEHLGTPTGEEPEEQGDPTIKNVIVEGQYGVVRNHIYDITIQTINNLGGGIYNPGTADEPGEPIIPDDPKDTYYMSAQINVLSWKVVSQKVDL